MRAVTVNPQGVFSRRGSVCTGVHMMRLQERPTFRFVQKIVLLQESPRGGMLSLNDSARRIAILIENIPCTYGKEKTVFGHLWFGYRIVQA